MLLMDELKSGDYKEHMKVGKSKTVSGILSKIKGEKTYKTLSETDTTAYKRVLAGLTPLYGVGNTHNKFDQAISIARSTTSLVFMGGNVLGAIKNAIKGYHDMVMEARAGQFVDGKSLHEGISTYRKIIPNILADLHKEYSDNIDVAILKHPTFQHMLELRDTDGQLISIKENKQKFIALTNNAAFFGMNATEHFMQYSMLFGMMRSHRLVGGRAISYHQFIQDSRERVLLELLEGDRKQKYLDYKKKVENRGIQFSNEYDTVTKWTEVKENMSIEELKTFGDKVKIAQNAAKENFNKLPTVYEQFELKDGRAVIKEGSNLSPTELNLFMAKTQKVNQQLHGVYNRVDKMALRNMAWGDLAMQFRSWVRPNFARYSGKRWNRSTYSEALMGYQKGAYISLWDLVTTPIRANRSYTGEQRTAMEAFVNILTDYAVFFKNAGVYYNRLSPHEKANIQRALTNFYGIILTSGALSLLGVVIDEDEDSVTNYAVALAIYELNMVHSEITQLVPIAGWHGFYTRSKQHPFASEKVIFDAYKLAQNLLTYPLQNEEARRYQRGIHSGRLRIEVQAEKLTPIYRQKDKFVNMQQYVSWYRLYNPFSWMFGLGN